MTHKTLSVASDDGSLSQTELRTFGADHADALHALIEDNRAFLGKWLPWASVEQSPHGSEVYVDHLIRSGESGMTVDFGIWQQGRLVGLVALEKIDPKNRKCQMGYWLGEGYAGRGLMFRCCETVLRHAFRELRFHRITVRCATENIRSRKLAERLGFRLEGTIRETEWLGARFVDHALYGLLENEFLDS